MTIFIENAGASIATRNVLNGHGRIAWLERGAPADPADNGWRVFGEHDDTDYVNDPANLRIVDYNELCAIEPALIGTWGLPFGSRLTIQRLADRIAILDDVAGREIPLDELPFPPRPTSR